MCTVSYIHLPKNKFLLTSSRDEAIARGLALSPQILDKGTYKLAAPVDPLASGTWIAASDYGDVVCLLNGAFKKHQHQPPYRKSRGLVVMDYFDNGNPGNFYSSYDLINIEPFTMVIISGGNNTELFELRWNGKEKFFKSLNAGQMYLWSSATLYREETAAAKERLFRKIIGEQTSNSLTPELLLRIHQKFFYQDWVFPPERIEMVATLSITSLELKDEIMNMYYQDLIHNSLSDISLALEQK